jgi:hypothetical protein
MATIKKNVRSVPSVKRLRALAVQSVKIAVLVGMAIAAKNAN